MKTKYLMSCATLALLASLVSCSGGSDSDSNTLPPVQQLPPPPPPPASPPPPPPPPPPTGMGFTLQSMGLLDGNSGNGQEHGRGVAVDSTGAIYIVGGTSSADFPMTAGAFDTTFATGGSSLGSEGPLDGFVTKIDAQGQVVWSTYLGGPNYERAYSVKVDSAGAVYIAGRAGDGFPTTPGVLQETFAGDSNRNPAYGTQDGFVTKLSADGGSLIWSTYFGGPGRGFIRDMDIDQQGRVHITFISYNQMPHITADADRSNRLGVSDAGYAVLSADGRSVIYATYLGGTSVGSNFSPLPFVHVTDDGGAYVAYYENATDVPVSATAFQKTMNGVSDIVVSRISPLRTLDWTTYLGGSNKEEMETHSLTVDANNRPVIVGSSFSKDFPVTPNVVQTAPGNNTTSDEDAFIAILSATGDRLIASSYFGGNQPDYFEGVAVLSDGTIVASGGTRSNFLPTDSTSFQSFNGGQSDGMLAQFSSDLSSVLYTSYFGGSGIDGLTDVASGPQNLIAFSGLTASSNFPVVNSTDVSIDGRFGAVYGRLESN